MVPQEYRQKLHPRRNGFFSQEDKGARQNGRGAMYQEKYPRLILGVNSTSYALATHICNVKYIPLHALKKK